MTLSEALERYEPVIGLEVHAQLKTATKLFSAAPNRFDPGGPNRAVTPYCLGLPGQLPVPNARAIELAVRAGLALGAEIRRSSTWARKQYFYPDLAKGYQISQYDQPICVGGSLSIPAFDGSTRTVRLERIHLEEDAGKLVHVPGAAHSLVDDQRAGVPLIEIVSAPDLRSAGEAAEYLRELRALLRALDVSDGNMEEGSFRCDANVSLRRWGDPALGRRVELKNINSFRFVEQAIEVEIVRHAELLDAGRTVAQETRTYDPERKLTRRMRSKEEAEDYRYLPEPDLPPLVVSDALVAKIAAELPELPAARRARWLQAGVPEEHARAFTEERWVADLFDAVVDGRAELFEPVAHLFKTELLRHTEPPALLAAEVRGLIEARLEARITSAQVKRVFQRLLGGERLDALLASEGSAVADPEVLGPILDELISSHPKEAARLAAGEEKLAGFFVGQVMRKTGGRADPVLVRELLAERLQA